MDIAQLTPTEWISAAGDAGQAIAALISVCALVAALVQLKRMSDQLKQDAKHNRNAQRATEQQLAGTGKQLADSREFAENQAKFFVVEYLERPENLQLRRRAERFRHTPRIHWSDDMQQDANLLSGMWEVVANLVTSGVVPEAFVNELYGGAIIRQWDLLQEHVTELRKTQGEFDQRKSFQFLAERFRRLRSANRGQFGPPPSGQGDGPTTPG